MDTRVGGVWPASRNVIAGSGLADNCNLLILARATVDGNLIGSDPTGTLDRTDGGGISVMQPAADVVIGGARANLIAFSSVGIRTNSIAGSGHSWASNSILANDNLGIDLNSDGVTANDLNDVDSGPNNLQNFPELNLAQQVSGGGLRVVGSLDVPLGTVTARYTIALYENVACDSGGFGEGTIYLGSQDVELTHRIAMPVVVNEDFAIRLAATPALGAVITATATAPDGSTSEFSRCITVVSSDQLLRNSFE